MASAQATLDAAELQTERLRRLLGDGLVSRREFSEIPRTRPHHRPTRREQRQSGAWTRRYPEQRAVDAEIGRIRADAQSRIDSAAATANKTQGELEDSLR